MDYDSTSIPQNYRSARRLSQSTMRRWLTAISRSAPLKPGARIADVGCGTGRFSSGLAEIYQSQVIGLDRSINMLSEASVRHRQVWFCLSDAEVLPLRQGSMGMVFLSNVIHHLGDLRRAAEGFARVLQPDGYVVVRNYLRDQLRHLPYLEFFPEALTFSMDSLDSKREVEHAFGGADFHLASYRSIEQPVADSPNLYLAKIHSRVYSDLAAISDEAFEAGVARMAAAVSAGWRRSLAEPIGLFSFRRRSAA